MPRKGEKNSIETRAKISASWTDERRKQTSERQSGKVFSKETREKISAAMKGVPRKHGQYKSRAYQSWIEMRRRCLDRGSDRYKDWGGRGITICDEWDDFSVFLEDMGERPAGKSLDRIDNESGYSPKNCRWSTPKEQANNRRPRSRESYWPKATRATA